jgi:hypothetical protein
LMEGFANLSDLLNKTFAQAAGVLAHRVTLG